MPQARYQGGGEETDARDDGRRPHHARLTDRLPVRQPGRDTGQTDRGVVRRIHVDLDQRVQVGNPICDAREAVDDGCREVVVDGIEGDLELLQRAEAGEFGIVARIQGLADNLESICRGFELEQDLPGARRLPHHVDGQTAIVRGEDDVEEAGGEAGVALALGQGGRFKNAEGGR